jgi:hypothetical protein
LPLCQIAIGATQCWQRNPPRLIFCEELGRRSPAGLARADEVIE